MKGAFKMKNNKLIRAICLCLCLAMLFVSFSACKKSENAPAEPSQEEVSSLTDETIKPYLDAYNQIITSDFGAETESTPYLRLYASEEDAMSNDPSKILKLVPDGEEIQEDYIIDPAYAQCFEVKNFSSKNEIKAHFSQFVDTDAEFFKNEFDSLFMEYDGKLYKVLGGRGYGSLKIDPNSAVIAKSSDNAYTVQLDSYLFDQKEDAPISLSLGEKDGKLVILSDK